MNSSDDQPNESGNKRASESKRPLAPIDVHSILMLVVAALILAWSFWPVAGKDRQDRVPIAVGNLSPPLRCLDPVTGEPLFALVPRGWFVWIVLGPDSDPDGARLKAEIEKVEAVWRTMADLDQWRRVIVTNDETTAESIVARGVEPRTVPHAIGLRAGSNSDSWSGAQRVRHFLIEPTGKILMIEPAETDHPGGIEKIRDDLRRRLRAWEGEFDDLPRFS
ncbi:hypothetical protein GC170_14980 [bacterium]|nr:hypothetical protein [bacterium]